MCELASWYNDGLCDERGAVVVPMRPALAVRLYRTAADAGDTSAMVSLACCLSSGHGVARDAKAALLLEKRAARLGDSTALHNVGVSYRNAGRYATAVKWFRKAALAGDESAMFEVAKAELWGIGTRRNVASALKMLKRIATSRRVAPVEAEEALLLLAHCYLDGWFVRRVWRKAVPWLERATQLGNSEARDLLEWLRTP